MKAYLINMHLLVPRSTSSAKVKVKYKGYISKKKKNGRFGGIRVSQTHLVLNLLFTVALSHMVKTFRMILSELFCINIHVGDCNGHLE